MTPAPYYQDDLVTLYHGDCREITEWTTADVLVTDPPYGMDLLLEDRFRRCVVCGAPSRSRSGTCKDCRGSVTVDANVSIVGDKDTSVRDAALTMWPERKPGIVFGTWKAPRPMRARSVIIWDKASLAGGGDLTLPWGASHEEIYLLGRWPKPTGRAHGVLRFQSLKAGQRERPDHPTPKPIPLMQALLLRCPNGVIADPFAGSGSTLLAAKLLGRTVVGVEIDERYCAMIARRLDQGVINFGAAV